MSQQRQPRSARGNELAKHWGLDVRHALYRRTGNWYHYLTRFPGALLDAEGYVVFATEQDFQTCPDLHLGKEVSVPPGIKSLPGYVRVAPSPEATTVEALVVEAVVRPHN
jgi:5-methylcytosine-specific restriction enzyme A